MNSSNANQHQQVDTVCLPASSVSPHGNSQSPPLRECWWKRWRPRWKKSRKSVSFNGPKSKSADRQVHHSIILSLSSVTNSATSAQQGKIEFFFSLKIKLRLEVPQVPPEGLAWKKTERPVWRTKITTNCDNVLFANAGPDGRTNKN